MLKGDVPEGSAEYLYYPRVIFFLVKRGCICYVRGQQDFEGAIFHRALQEFVVEESKWEGRAMLRKKKELKESKGFIGGALPNEKYTDDDLTKVQFLMDGLVFIIMIYVYNDKQYFDTQILVENYKHGGFDDKKVCLWCIMHGLKFEVITAMTKWKFWKLLFYLHLRCMVKVYERQYQGNFIFEDEEEEGN